jgi:hypothetical protein
MDNKEEYIVFIEKNGNRFYYKDGKLHREDGPAYVPSQFKEEYTGLADQELYRKIVLLHFDKDELAKVFKPEQMNGVSHPRLKELGYYLDGIQYPKRDFDKFALARKLDGDLSTNPNERKKPKI